MDENRIEEVKYSASADMHRKPYHTPKRLMVLGGIEEVVRSSVSAGSDATPGPGTGS